MKKTIPILLVLLLLAGCGTVPEPSPAPNAEATAAPTAPAATAEPIPAPTAAPEPAPAPSPAGETVTLDGVSSYLQVTLPAGWICAPGEDTASSIELLLTAPTEDGFQIKLIWWDFFGMCGTGVTFEEITLPDGRTATLATETGELTWWTLILPQSPDQFTLQIAAPQSAIDAHQPEIDAILATLQLGTRAELPPQPGDVDA